MQMTVAAVLVALHAVQAAALDLNRANAQTSLASRIQAQSKANPMRKIIGMLQDMAKELEREGELEKEIFEKAMCVCEGGGKELQKVVDDSTAAIDSLTSKTGAESAEKASLAQEIQEHKDTKAAGEADLAQATMLREKEYKTFVKDQKDTKMNLKQLAGAIESISGGMGGAAALMQMESGPKLRRLVEISKYISSDDRQNVLAFLDQGLSDNSGEQVKAPASGEILGILKNMEDEMSKDLKSMQDEEASNLANFNEMKAAKEQEIDMNEKSVIAKEKRAGGVALALSEDTHALEDAKEELSNAQNFLSTMDEQCANKKKEQGMRAKMRADEIAAVSDAIKILNDDDALDVFKKALPSAALVQQTKKTYDALLQLSNQQTSALKGGAAAKEEPKGVGEYAGQAETMVKQMIDGMVGTLHDEDVSDEHKKEWCANETQTGHNIEAAKKTLIQQTQAEISELTDEIAAVDEDIKTLESDIAATDKMVHEASEQRKKEHQEFVDSFATMATAIRLLDKAMTRLHTFYNPEMIAKKKAEVETTAVATAGLALGQVRAHAPLLKTAAVARLQALGNDFDFLQTSSLVHRVAPVELPDTPVTYEKKESGGVIGLMTSFKSDLKSDMTEAETEEKNDAKEYVRMMSEAKASRDQDTKSLTTKRSTKALLEEKLVSAKDLLKKTDDELHNIQLYLVQLHAECDFLLRNFEVRHEGRIEEERGLEDAETIVTGAEPPTHQQIEELYDSEHSEKDVLEHWPHTFGKATDTESNNDVAKNYGNE